METPRESSTEPSSRAASSVPARSPRPFGLGRASDLLGPWSIYFVAKLLLFWRELVGFHVVENMMFAIVLAVPLSSPRLRRARHWLAVPAAIALLYYDSWLPSASRVLSQAGLVWSFGGDYLVELAGRFVSLPVLALVAAAGVLHALLYRFVRTDLLAVVAIAAAGVLQAMPTTPAGATPPAAAGTAPRSPDTQLQEFFRAEAARAVTFAKPADGSVPFDVLFVHICSLSWDDLQATGLDRHPLFNGFDIVLRRFNAASTYSGPSAIRILRAACGQQPHRDLYAPAPENCLLMPDLQKAGLETNLVLNHDGHFDDFLVHVRAQGVAAAPLPLAGIPAPQRSFDESRIHDDLAVLSRWLEQRQKSAAVRVAAYYNTISLHDGNRLVADPKRTSLETYRERLARLLDDLDAFMKKLEGSGRRIVVVMVPEHGAAVRGDAAQIAGLREIPSPAITLVPVGVRVIGPGAKRAGEPLWSDEPASYLAVSHIVSRMLAKPPFGADGFRPADYVAGMPSTEFVSQSEELTMLRQGDRYLVKRENEPWKEYPASPAR